MGSPFQRLALPREVRLASLPREHPIFIALPATFEIAEKELQSAEI